MSRTETLEPVYPKLDAALRSIGYSFESAVADIVDNSIDAKAGSVLVRVITYPDAKLGLLVLDDGCGMAEGKLREAMRFGADVDTEISRLGKFGLGLKLASLSQAKALHVISCTEKEQLHGRAWLEHGIHSGFQSTIYDSSECLKIIESAIPDRARSATGTLVVWQDLYRVGSNEPDVDKRAQKLVRSLQVHLSLAFHRFLNGSRPKLRIELDAFDEAEHAAGLPLLVEGLDSFGYPATGNPEFPQELQIESKHADKIRIRLHIWPPNSDLPSYKLPGGANARQGFYFYRNNRLIQGGGWNGLRDAETHASLARVEVDLDPHIDVAVSLDVKKSHAQLPPDLLQAIENGRTGHGVTFKQYMGLADKAYRKREFMAKELPLVPGDGVPTPLQDFLYEQLRLDETRRSRKVNIRWAVFDDDSFFWVDRDEDAIYLNQEYRNRLLHGLRGSSADLPVLKCALFFLLENALYAERTGPGLRERLDLINNVLKKAVRFERTE
jgi:hypothetical protein